MRRGGPSLRRPGRFGYEAWRMGPCGPDVRSTVPGAALVLAGLLLAPVGAAAQSHPVRDPDTTSVLLQRRVYAMAPTGAGERELVVDLYRPVSGPPKGAVVIAHGGGFEDSYVDVGENKVYGQTLAQRGYLGAAIAYRSVEDDPVVQGWAEGYARMVRELGDPRVEGAIERFGTGFPDAVAAGAVDLIAAVEWLRSRAGELGFDPQDVALFGASAGGISSLTAAYAMELYGEEPLEVAGVIELRAVLLKADTADNPFEPDEPPLLMFHGEQDRSFALSEAEAVFRLAGEGGTPVEFHTAPDRGHELGTRGLLALRTQDGGTVLDRIDAFLEAAFAGEGAVRPGARSRLLPAESAAAGLREPIRR